MGTYHFLDGSKVRIHYRGNSKTCGRCHGDVNNCKGGAIAKECESAGGARVPLHVHMKKLWSEINFTPASFELPKDISDGDVENDIQILENQNFPRLAKAQEDKTVAEQYVGLSITNINKDIDDKKIQDFIRRFVSSEIKDEEIDIVRNKRKTTATISQNLTSTKVEQAMKRLNFSDCQQMYFERPLYCTPIRNMTPEKKQENNTSDIPGLSKEDQRKALQKQKEQEKKKDVEKGSSVSAFKILMDKAAANKKSDEQSKNSASPFLRTEKKRDSNELSSPSSPQDNDNKKTKPSL